MRSTVLACVIVAVSLAFAGTAGAQKSKFNTAAAKAAYIAAKKAEKKKSWKEAAKQYGVAYVISRDPILFYNIAFAFKQDGNCEFAIIYFKRFLNDTTPKPEARAKTDELINACKKKLGIKDEPEPVEPTVTGTTGGTTTDPGTGGGTTSTGTGGASFAGADAVDREASAARKTAWVSLGIAAALGATGAAFAIAANTREDDVDTLINFNDQDGLPRRYEGLIADRYNDKVDEGDSFETMAKVAFGAAGAAAVVGLAFFIIDNRSEGDNGATATISPTITADGAGVSAGWEF